MSAWLPRKLLQQETAYMQGKTGQHSSFLTLPFRYIEKNLFLTGILGYTVNTYFPVVHNGKKGKFWHPILKNTVTNILKSCYHHTDLFLQDENSETTQMLLEAQSSAQMYLGR